MEHGLHGFTPALAEAIQNKLPKKRATTTDRERFIIFPPSQTALSLIKAQIKEQKSQQDHSSQN